MSERQSRYDSVSEALQILQKTILDLEMTVDMAVGAIPVLRAEGVTNVKASPDPANVAFLISTMPVMMRQYAEKIQNLNSRLKDAFV